MNSDIFKRRVKAVMALRGMSFEALGLAMDPPRNAGAVRGILHTGNPRWETIQAFADALGVEVSQLIGEKPLEVTGDGDGDETETEQTAP